MTPSKSSPGAMVHAAQLTKRFGDKWALRNVDFQIERGQVFGLLGPNGAGKTTLFRILMGVIKPFPGQLCVAGLDAFDDRLEIKRLVGYLPDEPMFHSYLSGRDILELAAALHGLDPSREVSRLEPLIARMQLTEALDRFADDYSRGMKKKLGLLLALIHQPELLVLDEPTNGLDVESTRLFFEIVREQASAGTTILFSTHLIGQVEQLCSHIAILHEGGVVAQGVLAEIARSVPGADSLEQAFLALTRPRPMSALERFRAQIRDRPL
ncbi:MAG: ABC transporter ATP-binding protein [Lysobacterales bacterium]